MIEVGGVSPPDFAPPVIPPNANNEVDDKRLLREVTRSNTILGVVGMFPAAASASSEAVLLLLLLLELYSVVLLLMLLLLLLVEPSLWSSLFLLLLLLPLVL